VVWITLLVEVQNILAGRYQQSSTPPTSTACDLRKWLEREPSATAHAFVNLAIRGSPSKLIFCLEAKEA
jgi:hypothetical protein